MQREGRWQHLPGSFQEFLEPSCRGLVDGETDAASQARQAPGQSLGISVAARPLTVMQALEQADQLLAERRFGAAGQAIPRGESVEDWPLESGDPLTEPVDHVVGAVASDEGAVEGELPRGVGEQARPWPVAAAKDFCRPALARPEQALVLVEQPVDHQMVQHTSGERPSAIVERPVVGQRACRYPCPCIGHAPEVRQEGPCRTFDTEVAGSELEMEQQVQVRVPTIERVGRRTWCATIHSVPPA